MTKILYTLAVSNAYKTISVKNRQGLFVSWDFTLRLEGTTEKGSLVSETVKSFLSGPPNILHLTLLPLFRNVNGDVPKETLFAWSHLSNATWGSQRTLYISEDPIQSKMFHHFVHLSWVLTIYTVSPSIPTFSFQAYYFVSMHWPCTPSVFLPGPQNTTLPPILAVYLLSTTKNTISDQREKA